MDAALRKMQVDGLATSVSAWGHSLTLTTNETVVPPTTVTIQGVQTDVEVDPEQLKQFGFNVHRVFCFLVNNPAILSTIKVGMRAVDSNGDPCRFLHYKRDFLGVSLYFGSVNR